MGPKERTLITALVLHHTLFATPAGAELKVQVQFCHSKGDLTNLVYCCYKLLYAGSLWHLFKKTVKKKGKLALNFEMNDLWCL